MKVFTLSIAAAGLVCGAVLAVQFWPKGTSDPDEMAARAVAAEMPAAGLAPPVSESAWVGDENFQVKLVSATRGSGDAPKLEAGIYFRPGADWYTYWRMPGDAGLSPVFDWSRSSNIQHVEIGWPAPKRFDTFGLNSFGYDREILIPVTLTLAQPGQDVKVALDLQAVICKDVCVPQKVAVELDVPSGEALRSEYDYLLEQARKNLPSKGDAPDLRMETAVVGPNALAVTVWAQNGFDNPDMIVEAPDSILTKFPSIAIDDKEPRKAIFTVSAPESVDLPTVLTGQEVTITFINNGKAYEKAFSF